MSSTAPTDATVPTESTRNLPSLWTDRIRPADLDRLSALVTVADGADRTEIPVHAPFTGSEIGAVPAGTAADVELAVERARDAQAEWARRSPHERARVVRRFRSLLLDRREQLCDLLGIEVGKPRYHCFADVYDVVEGCRFYARRAPGYLTEERRSGVVPGMTAVRVRHRPTGVVGIVCPWNYPFMLSIGEAIPALLAGNAVVLKPAEETPFAALYGLSLLREAGLPPDVCQVVTGYGEEAGTALVERVDFVSFTGSTETGLHVGALAARGVRGCSLELGGKNAAIVLDDAAVDDTVENVVQGCFGNAGQVCMAPERLYVEAGIYDAFVAAFVDRTRELILGTGFEYEIEVGSLISADHLAKVEAHVAEAVAKGATVLAGGRARPDVGPYVYEPTILADVTPEMRVADEETFGPVVSIYPVADATEAAERTNDSAYGLNASVWSADRSRGARVARELDCGMVTINDPYPVGYASVEAPMGGTKTSGLGRRHGREGFTKYTEAQTIARNRGVALLAPGADAEGVARRMTRLARLLGRLPGLR